MGQEISKKRGITAQLGYLIIVGLLLAGLITHFLQYMVSERRVRVETGRRAAETAQELASALKEYPAYEWLLPYWYENAGQLDVEYDADFGSGTVTEEKERVFTARHPDHSIRYLSREEVEALSEEDQKLYAEIVYSWVLIRVNESKRNLDCDYLYLAVTGTDSSPNPYETQCFLMSGAEPGAVRGTEYGQVYTMGVTVAVDRAAVAECMREAVEAAGIINPDSRDVSEEGFSNAGNYVDYYTCIDTIGDKAYLAGATYDIKALRSQIGSYTIRYTLLALASQILLLLMVMRAIIQYMIQPLKKILASIRTYTRTRDSSLAEKEMEEILSGKRALAVRQNEIGQLADDFTTLTKEIDNYAKEITTFTSQKERYQTELNIAARIQEQELPKDFLTASGESGFDLYASMSPAREVGGDFYDFFFTDQDHLALVIGDVSDKGVPAALFMMVAKTLIKNLAKLEKSPAQIFAHVNDQLCENNEAGYFVTVWFALIDLRTGEGVAVNAGHEKPAVCRAGASYELISNKHSLSLGVMSGIGFRENEFQMYPGDQVFVYTDGVPEAINKDNEQFGTGRMLEVLNQNNDADPKTILTRMKEEIDAFAVDVPQFDDTTMLCFHYKGVKK